MRVALVTGGARGIGEAIARQLSFEGYFVAVADLDRVGAERVADGVGGVGVELDVRDARAFADVVERLERERGPVEVLVNNAGIMPVGPFTEQSIAMDQRQLDINVHGVIAGMRAVLPSMRARRRGHIVNIASVAGRLGCRNAAVYAAAKHAVIGLTESVRYEVLDDGVKLSWVAPGFVKTELIAGAPGPRWPPPVSPEQVARGVSRALRTGQVDVYVPRIARLSAILPALTPRPVYEAIGRFFGLEDMFVAVDARARAAYRERIGV